MPFPTCAGPFKVWWWALSPSIGFLRSGIGPLRHKRAPCQNWALSPVMILSRTEMGIIMPDLGPLISSWTASEPQTGPGVGMRSWTFFVLKYWSLKKLWAKSEEFLVFKCKVSRATCEDSAPWPNPSYAPAATVPSFVAIQETV